MDSSPVADPSPVFLREGSVMHLLLQVNQSSLKASRSGVEVEVEVESAEGLGVVRVFVCGEVIHPEQGRCKKRWTLSGAPHSARALGIILTSSPPPGPRPQPQAHVHGGTPDLEQGAFIANVKPERKV